MALKWRSGETHLSVLGEYPLMMDDRLNKEVGIDDVGSNPALRA